MVSGKTSQASGPEVSRAEGLQETHPLTSSWRNAGPGGGAGGGGRPLKRLLCLPCCDLGHHSDVSRGSASREMRKGWLGCLPWEAALSGRSRLCWWVTGPGPVCLGHGTSGRAPAPALGAPPPHRGLFLCVIPPEPPLVSVTRCLVCGFFLDPGATLHGGHPGYASQYPAPKDAPQTPPDHQIQCLDWPGG